MDARLLNMVIGAIAGAVAALVASFIAGKLFGKSKPAWNTAIFVVVFAVAMTIQREYVSPAVRQAADESQVIATLEKSRVFAAIKTYDPEAFATLVERAKQAIRDKQGDAYFFQLGVETSGAVVNRRLPTASDDAVVYWAQSLTTTLRELQSKSAEACYAALVGGPTSSTVTSLSESTRANLEEAQVRVIQSSATTPQGPASEEEMQAIIAPIVQSLHNKYGDKIAVLDQMQNPDVNKADACELLTALYEALAKLPSRQAGPVIRKMMKG